MSAWPGTIRRRFARSCLYHADTVQAPDALDIGTAQYHVENVFLSQLDGTQALTTVQAHLDAGRWEPPDRLRLALALNMHFSDRTDVLNTVLTLVSAIPSMTERDLVVSAMIILGNYALTDAERTRLRKELRKMSTIAEELLRDEHEEGLKEGEQIGIQKVAQAMPRVLGCRHQLFGNALDFYATGHHAKKPGNSERWWL